MRWRPGPSSRTRPPHCCRNPASEHNPAHIMRSQVASVLLWKPLPQRPEDEETDKDASEIAHISPKDGHLQIQRGMSDASSAIRSPQSQTRLKPIATSRMKVSRVSFFMLLPPYRGGYGCRKREVRGCDMKNVHSPIYRFSLSVASDASAAGQWRRAIGSSIDIGFQHPSQEAIRKAEPPRGSSAMFRTIWTWAISRGVPRRRGRS